MWGHAMSGYHWHRLILCGVGSLLLATPALACDENDPLKVVIASGTVTEHWSAGMLVCEDVVIDLAAGDFMLLRNRDSTRRLRGPRRVKVDLTPPEPVSGIAMLMRYFDLRSWRVGKDGKNANGGVRLFDTKFA